MMQQHHYLYEDIDITNQTPFFVFYCSDCLRVLRTHLEMVPPAIVSAGFKNQCPTCSAKLESTLACRSMQIPEKWHLPFEHPRKNNVKRQRPMFQSASSLLGFTFNFTPLDKLIGCFELGSLAVFTGRYAGAASELLCLRAQLPIDEGGLDSSVIFIDGGNCSDPYLFSSYAKQYGVQPERSLKNVVTSRAFTVHQLAGLIIRELPKAIDEYGSKLIVISDLLNLFSDPQIHREEAKIIIRKISETLKQLCSRNVITIVTLTTVTPYSPMVTSRADLVLSLTENHSRIHGSLLKHPSRRNASSQFPLHELLRPPRIWRER